MLVLNILKMCFKTYLNHPINQKTSQKKKPKGDHSFQKKRGDGPARYDHDHRFNGFFFLKTSLRRNSNDMRRTFRPSPFLAVFPVVGVC